MPQIAPQKQAQTLYRVAACCNVLRWFGTCCRTCAWQVEDTRSHKKYELEPPIVVLAEQRRDRTSTRLA